MGLYRVAALLTLLPYGLSPVFASEQPSLFQSTRAQGRGGTFVAANDSDEANYLNPATLAEADISYQLRLWHADGLVGENSINTISDLLSLATTSDGFGVLRKFEDKFGQKQYMQGQFSFLAQRFGSVEITPFAISRSWLEMRNEEIPMMQWESDTMTGLGITYALKLDATLALGITFRPLYRWYIAGDITSTDLMEFLPPAEIKFEEFTPLVSGFALGGDLGAVWAPSKDFRLGLTVQNVGDSNYTQDFGTEPPPIRQIISLGMLSRYQIWRFDLDWFLDYQGVTNRDGINMLRLLHTGLELGMNYISRDHDVGLTMGINEGFLTFGGFLDLVLFRLDISNYGVERGVYPGDRLERRWLVAARSTMTF